MWRGDRCARRQHAGLRTPGSAGGGARRMPTPVARRGGHSRRQDVQVPTLLYTRGMPYPLYIRVLRLRCLGVCICHPRPMRQRCAVRRVQFGHGGYGGGPGRRGPRELDALRHDVAVDVDVPHHVPGTVHRTNSHWHACIDAGQSPSRPSKREAGDGGHNAFGER